MQQRPFFSKQNKARQFKYQPVYYNIAEEEKTAQKKTGIQIHRKSLEVSAEKKTGNFFIRNSSLKRKNILPISTLMLLLVFCGSLFYLFEAGLLSGMAVLILLFIALFIFIFRK